MEFYMKNREHKRMILESVENGPLIWPTVKENRVTRTKKYAELLTAKKIQADCDMKATNIILHGLPVDIYALLNHHKVSKDLWERVQLLMQGTSLTKQERECKLYDAYDRFTHIKGESLHKYYLRFTQLINDMNIYNMNMEQFQVNTKFLNSLPSEWRDDPIACLNKAMAFLTAIASLRFPSTNNQLRISFNLRNHATIQDGRTEDLGTYDSDCDDISNAKSVLMANISNYGSKFIVEVPHSETYLNDMENQGYQNPCYLKKAKRIKPTLYDGIVISNKHVAMPVIDDEETLILEEVSRSKMSRKDKDLEAIKQKISNKPIDYVKLNKIYEDFGKHFVPQQEVSADEAFWYHMLNPSTKYSVALHVKIEAPKELSKDLKAQIQDKVFVITSLKNDLRKLKGKEIVDIAAQTPSAHTIVLGMFKLELEPLAQKLLENKEIHVEYLMYTQEQADILWGTVEQAKAKQPLDNELDFACCPDCSLVSRLQMFKTYDREPLSAHELPGLHSMNPTTSSSGLVLNTVSQEPCIPPNIHDWDHLFQPMFDEYFTPPSIAVSLVPVAAASRAVDLVDSPVSTSID
nr:hypothetical protein [Tanacetum cinerariifolium]